MHAFNLVNQRSVNTGRTLYEDNRVLLTLIHCSVASLHRGRVRRSVSRNCKGGRVSEISDDDNTRSRSLARLVDSKQPSTDLVVALYNCTVDEQGQLQWMTSRKDLVDLNDPKSNLS